MRYIDDALGLWHGNSTDLMDFLDSYSQGLNKHIKITRCVSQTDVVFLDVHIFKGVDFRKTHKLSTRCHKKELNRYHYLPCCSWHPKHQKVAFITGELKRYVVTLGEDDFSFSNDYGLGDTLRLHYGFALEK